MCRPVLKSLLLAVALVMPEGAGAQLDVRPVPIPDGGVAEHLRALPRIDVFRATVADCPRPGADLGAFLEYRVTNGVSRVAIHAVQADGPVRRFFSRSAPTPGRLEGRTADRRISTGQVAYVLEAVGAGGRSVSKRIPFRTSDRPTVTFEEPWREVVHPDRRERVLNHYEVDVDVTHLASIRNMGVVLLRGLRAKDPATPIVHVEFRNGRLVSDAISWTVRHPNQDEVERGLLKVDYQDQCFGRDEFEIEHPVRHAP